METVLVFDIDDVGSSAQPTSIQLQKGMHGKLALLHGRQNDHVPADAGTSTDDIIDLQCVDSEFLCRLRVRSSHRDDSCKRGPRPKASSSWSTSSHVFAFIILQLSMLIAVYLYGPGVICSAGADRVQPVSHEACVARFPQCGLHSPQAHTQRPSRKATAYTVPSQRAKRAVHVQASPVRGLPDGGSAHQHITTDMPLGQESHTASSSFWDAKYLFTAQHVHAHPAFRLPNHAHIHHKSLYAKQLGLHAAEQATCQFSQQTINVMRDLFTSLRGNAWQGCGTPWTASVDVAQWCYVTTTGCGINVALHSIPGLAGTLPSSLGDLTELEVLVLNSNALLSGTIPSSLGGLPRLQALDLHLSPRLSGSIPESLGSLPQLKALAIYSNALLSGTIPTSLGSLSQLVLLEINSNPLLDGTIPSSFGGLTQLQKLMLYGNPRVSGTIPPSLGSLSRLRGLYLFSNPVLSGSIPHSLGNISQLQQLSIYANPLLSGTIPSSLGNLTQLLGLSLYSNPRLSGTIPSSLGGLSLLQGIGLFSNELLSGTIPPSLGKLSQLQVIAIFSNALLSGTIPSSLGLLSQLQVLAIDQNPLLSGTIPASLGNLTLLQRLELHSNPYISGTIPASLGDLSHLQFLSLYSYPLLSGTIPPSLSKLSQLQAIGLYENPRLSGTLPAWLGNLPLLRGVFFYRNSRLSGTIPPTLGQLSQLLELGLYAIPNLSGTIPESLGSLSLLRIWGLNSNPLLSGTIPESLGNLVSLQKMYLYLTSVSGTIPSSLGGLSQLVTLQLNQMAFLSGTIPPSLGNLSQMQMLYLFSNPLLSGTLPSSLGSLSQLQQLSIYSDPLLSGNIPSSFGHLSKLQKLQLYLNALSGTIPPSLGNLTELILLDVHSNDLDGTLPSSLGDLSQLVGLGLNNNARLSGTIPSSLGNLSKLQVLLVYANPRISGTIPPSLGSLSQLKRLGLYANDLLSGTIPASLGTLSQLQTFYVYANRRMSGTIPPSLANLSQLQQLEISSYALLSGTFPLFLCNLTQLQRLGMSRNDLLSGTIPSALHNLTQFLVMNMYSNPRLSGTVPLALGSLPQLQVLGLRSNPLLSGTVPSSLGSSPTLQSLDVSDCPRLSGTIPPLNSSTLTLLSLTNTNVTGELPARSFAPALAIVELARTRLSGSVPNTICSWRGAEKLDFSLNGLTGTLPACISHLSLLNILAVSGNRLSGAFARILPLGLRGAYLNDNLFTYTHDDCLSPNSTLEVLDLSDSSLSTAFMQAAVCYLRPRLRVVRLNNCSLSGVFDISNQTQCSTLADTIHLPSSPRIALSVFDVSSNRLSGVFDVTLRCCNCEPQVPLRNRLPFLDTISLSHTAISVQALPVATEAVQLVGISDVTAAALVQILSSPVLQQANLHQIPVPNQSLASLAALVQPVFPSTQTVTYPDVQVNCPQLKTEASGGNINIDFGLFGYQQCNCTQPSWFWNDINWRCEPCPTPRLRCDASLMQPIHTVAPDYYPLSSPLCISMDCLPRASFLPCLAAGVCSVEGPGYPRPADQPALVAGYYCAVGHDPHSRLCSMCLSDYFLYGTSCGACHSWAAALVPLVIIVCLVAYVFFLRHRAAKHDRRSDENSTISFTSLLLVVYWLQLVYLTTTESNGSSSTAHGHVFGWLQSLAMFHPWGVDCTFPGLKQHHLELILTLPITLTAVVCAGLYLVHAMRPTNSQISLNHVLKYGFHQTWELLYMPVCAAVFQSLACHHGSYELDFLERAPYRSCGEPGLTTIAVLTLLYFICGYPLVHAYKCFQRSRNPDTSAAHHSSSRKWWWEPCLIRARSVYVSVVVFTLPLQYPLIPLLIYIALLLNVLVQLFLAPYTDPTNNRLSVVTLTSLLIIYLCSMIDDNSYSSAPREVVIILTFSTTLVYVLGVLLPRLARSFRSCLSDLTSSLSAATLQGGAERSQGHDYVELRDADTGL